MLYQILPRYDYKFQQDSMQLFLKTLSSTGKQQTFFDKLGNLFDRNCILDYRFIIDCDGKENTNGMISFYLQVTNDKLSSLVLNSLQNMFQEKADVFESPHKLIPYNTAHTLFTTGELEDSGNTQTKKEQHRKSLATFQDDRLFLFILGTMSNKTRITIDFSIRKNYSSTKSLFRGVATDVDAEVMIKVSGKTKFQRNLILEITNTIINLTAAEKEYRAIYRDTYRFSTVSGNELMNLFQIPTFYGKPDDLEVLRHIHKLEIGQRTLKEIEFTSGIKCGRVYHPMQDRSVFINEQQLRKHMFITGQTGSGKSSASEEMMRHILYRKVTAKKPQEVPGFSFFDPAETSALGVIDMMLKLKADGHDTSELEKIIHYVDFGYDDCVFPISLLNKDVPSTEILDFFKTLFGDAPTVNVDRMITSAINTILMDDEEHTIMDIPKLLRSEKMREKMLMRLQDNLYAGDARAFLKGKFNSNQLDPVLNRIDPFTNTPKKKLMFGMHSKYDGLRKIREWINNGHIILFNLKGLNDRDMKIIIGYISLKYYLIGLQRNDNSLLHMTFIDESHKVQFSIFQRWLAELRKGGMSLIPMTQYLDQYNPSYLQALLGNVGTKMTFRQGDDGARRLVMNLPGNLDKEALKRLPDRIGYLSTEDNRIAKSALLEVDPPYRYNDGKLVPHPDDKEIQTNRNLATNRNVARELMKRDFISKEDAEQIVFHKQFRQKEDLQLETELLEEGDALWDD